MTVPFYGTVKPRGSPLAIDQTLDYIIPEYNYIFRPNFDNESYSTL
jgi:hypothetical protein